MIKLQYYNNYFQISPRMYPQRGPGLCVWTKGTLGDCWHKVIEIKHYCCLFRLWSIYRESGIMKRVSLRRSKVLAASERLKKEGQGAKGEGRDVRRRKAGNT